jgi:hypothetical protein
VSSALPRAAAVADRRVTGLSPQVLAELVAELGPRWQARQDARLADRPRRRAVGAGARYRLVFLNRLLATLVHLRHGVTHDVLACWVRVPRSTITPAVGEVRQPQGRSRLHHRGRVRLPAQANGVADLGGQRAARPLDAPGSRCATRRHTRPRDSGPSPARPAPRPPRTLFLTDPAGRLLFCAQTRPGAIHHLTQVRQAARVELAASRASPCWLTPGYQGLQRADRRFRPEKNAVATGGRPVEPVLRGRADQAAFSEFRPL